MKTADGHVNPTVVVFFISFVALVGIVALNIIVAVLLEGFVSSLSHADISQRIQEEAKEHHKMAGALDPLLATYDVSLSEPLCLCACVICAARSSSLLHFCALYRCTGGYVCGSLGDQIGNVTCASEINYLLN